MFNMMPFDNRERNLFHYLDNLERNFFGDLPGSFSQFRTDILDKGDKYVLQAELPGFSKEEIKVNVDNNFLTISAEHNEDKEDKKDSYVRRERRYGSFSRSFDISNVDAENITASYDKGVLELTLPKQNKTLPPNRQIEIK